MKSINQIFESNKELMKEPEVQELIEYSKELEDQVGESSQNKTVSKEKEMGELIKEIHQSCVDDLKTDADNKRWPELGPRVDFTNSIALLKKYLVNRAKDNKFRL